MTHISSVGNLKLSVGKLQFPAANFLSQRCRYICEYSSSQWQRRIINYAFYRLFFVLQSRLRLSCPTHHTTDCKHNASYTAPALNLHLVPQKVSHFYFYDNFGKRGPILTILSLMHLVKIKEAKAAILPQLCRRYFNRNFNT